MNPTHLQDELKVSGGGELKMPKGGLDLILCGAYFPHSPKGGQYFL